MLETFFSSVFLIIHCLHCFLPPLESLFFCLYKWYSFLLYKMLIVTYAIILGCVLFTILGYLWTFRLYRIPKCASLAIITCLGSNLVFPFGYFKTMSQIHHTWGIAHLFPPKANFCQLPHLHQRYHHFLTTQFLNPKSFLTVPSPCQLPYSINPAFANSLKSAPPNPLLLHYCRLLSPLSWAFLTLLEQVLPLSFLSIHCML